MIFNIPKEYMTKSGIYAIQNIENGKIYIGQTKKLRKRFNDHLNQLQTGTHGNKYLLNEYNKYGSDSFVFELVEICSTDNLNTREQYFINQYYDNQHMCFNIKKDVYEPRGHDFVTFYNRSEQMKLQWSDPNNREKFLKAAITRKELWENDIERKEKRRLLSKQLWETKADLLKKKIGEANKNLPKDVREKVNKVVSDNFSIEFTIVDGNTNTIVTGKNITQFCEEHNLKSRGMFSQVVRGKLKYYKTWKHICNDACECAEPYDGRSHSLPSELPKPVKVIKTPSGIKHTSKAKAFTLLSPDNVVYQDKNIMAFSQQHNLCFKHLSAVIAGKEKSHKGWRLPENLDYVFQKKKTYDVVLISPTGEKYGPIVGLKDFAIIHGLKLTNLSALIKGKLQSTQGWRLEINKEYHFDRLDLLQQMRSKKATKTYEITNPSNELFIINNLYEFERSQNWSTGYLCKILARNKTNIVILFKKGWQIKLAS